MKKKRNVCGTAEDGKSCHDYGALAIAKASVPNGQAVAEPNKTNVKKLFYKKWWLWVIAVVIIIGAIGSSGDKPDTSNDTGVDTSIASRQGEENNDEKIVIKSIEDFKTKEYSVETGDSVELSARLKPKGLSKDDIIINNSDPAIVGITDLTVTNKLGYTELKFKCNAVAAGTSIINVASADGKIASDDVTFTVEQAPRIKSISKFGTSYASDEVGDTRNITVYMTPAGITKEDFIITNTDNSVVEISNVEVTDDGDKTVLTFTTQALNAGNAAIAVVSSDGKTESNALSLTVKEKDTSRTVYVTPYGEKYHFSSDCAGKNATATTLVENVHIKGVMYITYCSRKQGNFQEIYLGK